MRFIKASCYFDADSPEIAGFQIIAQLLSDPTQLYKLYVNEIRDIQPPSVLATVEVEEIGTYLVYILLIKEEIGIIHPDVLWYKTELTEGMCCNTVEPPNNGQLGGLLC